MLRDHAMPMENSAAAAGSISQTMKLDPITSQVLNPHTHRDQEIYAWMNNLRSMPSENYVFSQHQHTKQYQLFKDKRDQLVPNMNLDLYNAAIVAARM
jgi:hypothetical protein